MKRFSDRTTAGSLIDRRTMLKTSAAAGVLVGGGLALNRSPLGVFGATSAHAQTNSTHTSPGRLAVVFLRGGMDGLSAVVPHSEAAYYDARPTIAIPDSVTLDLDGQFGFHPAMGGLHTLFEEQRLSVVVGAGHMAGERSHFVAQDLWEHASASGAPDGLGWLGRHLTTTAGADDGVFRGVTMGNLVNTSFQGSPAMGIATIDDFGLGGFSGVATGKNAVLGELHSAAQPGNRRIDTTGQAALSALDLIAGIDGAPQPDAGYPNDPVAQSFAEAAILFDSGLGTEVITLDIGHWDTHAAMGTHEAGEMRDLLGGLDGYLSGFQADLDARGLTDVTTIVMTEFGRRVAENGSQGCDHGWGSIMMVMGDRAKGGVHGTWAGLDPATIGSRGDVVPTTDCLDVIGDVATDVLGGTASAVLPGHDYKPVGVLS